LRAAGESETTQEHIQDGLDLDGDPGFQLLTEEEICCSDIFYIYFHQHHQYYYIFYLLFSKFFVLFLF
jgi:hypothetical protein